MIAFELIEKLKKNQLMHYPVMVLYSVMDGIGIRTKAFSGARIRTRLWSRHQGRLVNDPDQPKHPLGELQWSVSPDDVAP